MAGFPTLFVFVKSSAWLSQFQIELSGLGLKVQGLGFQVLVLKVQGFGIFRFGLQGLKV